MSKQGSAILKGQCVAALDVGSTRVVCLLASVIDDMGALEILGVGHQASKGVQSGVISDLQTVEKAVRETIHQAELMAGDIIHDVPLHHIVVSVPAGIIHSENRSISVDLQAQDVRPQDIAEAVRLAQDMSHSEGRELIHAISRQFTLDGHKGMDNPVGLSGQVLEVHTHLVSAELAGLKNLAHCIEQCHLSIETLCCTPYASALSVLDGDERTLGCTVIDMGGETTSYAVMAQDRLVASGSVPVGGHHVTKDIAQGMNTSLSHADRIKILYGSAIATISDDHDMIDVPQLGDEDHDEPLHVPRSMLVGIMQPRLEEIFEMVREELSQIPEAAISSRIIITGGGSQTAALKDLAEMIFNKQVRIGRPDPLPGLPDMATSASFSCCIGLLYYALYRSDERPYDIIAKTASDNRWVRMWQWLKENW